MSKFTHDAKNYIHDIRQSMMPKLYTAKYVPMSSNTIPRMIVLGPIEFYGKML